MQACTAAAAHKMQQREVSVMRSVLRGVVLRGVPFSVCGMLIAGVLLTAADLPFGAYAGIAAVPLLAGSFFAGMEAGRRHRRNGLLCGGAAGLLLTALWYAAAWLLLHRAGLPAVGLAAVPCGMCGGVTGTGRRVPELHRRLHGAVSLRERLRLRAGMLHKPKKSPLHKGGGQEKI